MNAIFQICVMFDVIMLGAALTIYIIEKLNNKK